MLLQDSLGGDAKALMFCNVAPVALHAGDTFSSLNFASKVLLFKPESSVHIDDCA